MRRVEDPRAAKRELRTRLRGQRREISAARDLGIDDAALRGHILTVAETARPTERRGVALTYLSFPHEPPTTATNRALVDRGWQVLAPITLDTLDLDWFDIADEGRTPLGVGAPQRADLALVPGLAVDRHGTRMGQGGGCYDRVLPRLRAGTPFAVLLHPGELTTDPLPREPHDQPVRLVLTADGPVEVG